MGDLIVVVVHIAILVEECLHVDRTVEEGEEDEESEENDDKQGVK